MPSPRPESRGRVRPTLRRRRSCRRTALRPAETDSHVSAYVPGWLGPSSSSGGSSGAVGHARQAPPAQPTFRAEIALVEVAAVVTGDGDAPIADLDERRFRDPRGRRAASGRVGALLVVDVHGDEAAVLPRIAEGRPARRGRHQSGAGRRARVRPAARRPQHQRLRLASRHPRRPRRARRDSAGCARQRGQHEWRRRRADHARPPQPGAPVARA